MVDLVILYLSDQLILRCYDVLVNFTHGDLLLGLHCVDTVQRVVQDEDYKLEKHGEKAAQELHLKYL